MLYQLLRTDDRGKAVYKDVCHPITAKFRDKLYSALLQAYEKVKGQENTKDSVLGKLSDNKEAAKKSAEQKVNTAKSKGKKHEKDTRNEAR